MTFASEVFRFVQGDNVVKEERLDASHLVGFLNKGPIKLYKPTVAFLVVFSGPGFCEVKQLLPTLPGKYDIHILILWYRHSW